MSSTKERWADVAKRLPEPDTGSQGSLLAVPQGGGAVDNMIILPGSGVTIT